MTMNKKRFRQVLWAFSVLILLIAFLLYGGVEQFPFALKGKDKKPIRAIIQTGPQKEALKTAYLAELLDLSIDHPLTLCTFDRKKALSKLLLSPVIKTAEVKVMGSGVVYIDYMIRQPLALLGDFENVALDEEGYPFPVTPFFSPKNLPEIYLGYEGPLKWNEPITGEKTELAFLLLGLLNGPIVKDLFNIKRIDVSSAFEKSYGRREIVLLTEDTLFFGRGEEERCVAFPRILRLSTKETRQNLSNYLKLRAQLLETAQKEGELFSQAGFRAPTQVIDFRIPQLAFIEEGKEK